MAPQVFISYRRDDSEGEAGRLFDDLSQRFGPNSVFMDVAGISPGVDFRKAIDDNVAQCAVLLVMIGPAWATLQGETGTARLREPNDFVRLEVATALKGKTAVIPVLVHGAKMPKAEQLPEELKDLVFRNCVELTHARWNSDLAVLVSALEPFAGSGHGQAHSQASAASPVASAESKGRGALMAVASVVLLVLVGGGAYWWHARGQVGPTPGPVNPAVVAPAPVAHTKSAVSAGGVTSPPDASSQNAFVGAWARVRGNEDGTLSHVWVASGPKGMLVRIWGFCGTQECDWGTHPASMTPGGDLTSSFAVSGRRVDIDASTLPNGNLSIDTASDWANGVHGHKRFPFARQVLNP